MKIKHAFGHLLWWSGRLLTLLTAFAVLVYTVNCIVWLHAPALVVLLVAASLALPLLLLAWVLKKAGARLKPRRTVQPWFETRADTGLTPTAGRKKV